MTVAVIAPTCAVYTLFISGTLFLQAIHLLCTFAFNANVLCSYAARLNHRLHSISRDRETFFFLLLGGNGK